MAMALEVAILLLLAGRPAAAGQAIENRSQRSNQVSECLPHCHWTCDEPSCPAKCTPKCMEPTCEHMCKPLGEPECNIRCEKPECEVRCVKAKCADGRCPVCENVCLPAKCQTICTPRPPECKPQCSRPSCTWLCKKPTSCPKPKCMLKCEEQGPESLPTGSLKNIKGMIASAKDKISSLMGGSKDGGKKCPPSSLLENGGKCCPCNNVDNLSAAIEIANSVHVRGNGSIEEHFPSLVEVHDEYHYHHGRPPTAHSRTGKHGFKCCPCAHLM